MVLFFSSENSCCHSDEEKIYWSLQTFGWNFAEKHKKRKADGRLKGQPKKGVWCKNGLKKTKKKKKKKLEFKLSFDDND